MHCIGCGVNPPCRDPATAVDPCRVVPDQADLSPVWYIVTYCNDEPEARVLRTPRNPS